MKANRRYTAPCYYTDEEMKQITKAIKERDGKTLNKVSHDLSKKMNRKQANLHQKLCKVVKKEKQAANIQYIGKTPKGATITIAGYREVHFIEGSIKITI